ncbi:unnamed protein product [Periconia digitata]|uniref:Uncharacterized protein n=1 Tax=Periconia digitata TaxID=1303443 RepID=A0A9W4UCT7_9PLEO|nr:unnamed protein product [Periconia digitata]
MSRRFFQEYAYGKSQRRFGRFREALQTMSSGMDIPSMGVQERAQAPLPRV